MSTATATDQLSLTILTPTGELLSETVDAVYGVAQEKGSFGILPKHIPMVTPLEVSVLRFVKGQQEERIAVMGGVFSTDGKNVTVLANAAERAKDIDVLRAEEAKKRAESRLKEKEELVDANRAQLALVRALTRLKASQ